MVKPMANQWWLRVGNADLELGLEVLQTYHFDICLEPICGLIWSSYIIFMVVD